MSSDIAGNTPPGIYAEILRNLVGFPTISSDSNLPCIEYIDDFLTDQGFTTRRDYNQDKTKANLIAQIGPDTDGGIMLSGHTDVVPVSGQDWQSDPFSLYERDGRLYGRGTSDMKGFLAIAMFMAASIDPGRLSKPLYLVFTYDEEIGCLGAKSLMDEFKGMNQQPDFVLIGEPTNMELVTAHKGICISKTEVRGKPGHACRPDDGASAIFAAVNLISKIGSIMPKDRDEAFDPPAATFNIGMISGGNATNIIAQDCAFEWEFRPLPTQDPETIQATFRNLVEVLTRDMPGIMVRHEVDAIVPGMQKGENIGIASKLQSHMQDTRLTTAAFTTEGGIYQQAGIPAIVCGPGHISQAHQPDEYITVDMMEKCLSFLFKVVESYTSNN